MRFPTMWYVRPAKAQTSLRGKVRKLRTSVKFRQRPCLIHIIIIGIKNNQVVSSGVPLFANVCLNLPGVRSFMKLP